MEHVERQEEREQEIKSSVDELDEQGDQFEEQVGELREEWQQRTGSAEAPGAQEPDELAEVSGNLESPDDTGDDEDDEDDESDEDDQPEPRPEEDE